MPQVDLQAFVSTKPYTNDFPPESYFLSKDAQLEWLSDNAFLDRKDSLKRNFANSNSNPSSQRFLPKSKASIIGLPKPQQTCFNETKKRRNVGNNKTDHKNRVILKRVGSLLEPSSPMVSCMGRVRSKRERSRMHRQKSGRVDPNRVKKPGVLAGIKAIFRIGASRTKDIHTPPQSRTRDIRTRLPPESAEPVVPGLGGMSRFASGRRADLLGHGA